ncbi:MAG: succinate dehydrogenase cytochrome b subunit [Vulcanimicrobiota bacterium]
MNLATAAQSSIGRKLINGFTGLLLVGFVIGHLIGNLLLLVGPKAFNDYAYFLEHMFHGAGLIVAEVGLIVLFLSHAWSGYSVWRRKWEARQYGYAVPGDAGGVSKKSVSSNTMLWTGILLLGFVIWHVLQFKFGIIDRETNRQVLVNGVEMRDLYGLVIDTFASPVWTGVYLIIMAALGFHLWHGAWSAFQSLGLANANYLPTITRVAHGLAALLAFGFLFLPAYIMLSNESLQDKDQMYLIQYQVTDQEREVR